MRFTIWVNVLIASLLFISCGKKDSPPGGSGFIEATQIVVSSEVGGQLKRFGFEEGDLIAEGEIIGEIDTITTMLYLHQAQSTAQVAELRVKTSSLKIDQASFNLDLARKEYDRVSALLESGSIDQQHYDQVENVYEQAILSKKEADAAYESALAELSKIRSEMALLEKQLSDCFPQSPESGVITSKFVEAGELIGVGQPLIEIAKLDTVWVKIYLPPNDLTRIKLGDPAQIDPEDGRSQPLEGKVSWISDQAEFTPKNVQTKEARADLVYAVKITIPNPKKILKIGMPVWVEIK
jgi:HlyD family secretion protein